MPTTRRKAPAFIWSITDEGKKQMTDSSVSTEELGVLVKLVLEGPSRLTAAEATRASHLLRRKLVKRKTDN